VIRNKRGVALVIAMLVMLSLVGLTFLAAESTVREIQYAGGGRLVAVGSYVAEGGHALVMGQVGLTPGVLGASNYQLTDAFFGGTFSELPADNGPNTDPGSFGPDAFVSASAGFTTRFESPVSTNRVPGFSSDLFVFTKYSALTDGFYQVGAGSAAFTRRAAARVGGQVFVFTGTREGL
jgi:hypothetical protein